MRGCILGATLAVALPVRADAVDLLRDFARDARSGRANFTQTVISPDGTRKRTSRGRFEFLRPDRFRFAYDKPDEQLIVSDGRRVWMHDVELEQVTARPVAQALGATPAALLAGGSLERDFELAALPPSDGLQWAQATPRAKDSPFASLRVGFDGPTLAAIELTDAFGQTSLLRFSDVQVNVDVKPESFRFTPPPGVDVIEQ